MIPSLGSLNGARLGRSEARAGQAGVEFTEVGLIDVAVVIKIRGGASRINLGNAKPAEATPEPTEISMIDDPVHVDIRDRLGPDVDVRVEAECVLD